MSRALDKIKSWIDRNERLTSAASLAGARKECNSRLRQLKALRAFWEARVRFLESNARGQPAETGAWLIQLQDLKVTTARVKVLRAKMMRRSISFMGDLDGMSEVRDFRQVDPPGKVNAVLQRKRSRHRELGAVRKPILKNSGPKTVVLGRRAYQEYLSRLEAGGQACTGADGTSVNFIADEECQNEVREFCAERTGLKPSKQSIKTALGIDVKTKGDRRQAAVSWFLGVPSLRKAKADDEDTREGALQPKEGAAVASWGQNLVFRSRNGTA